MSAGAGAATSSAALATLITPGATGSETPAMMLRLSSTRPITLINVEASLTYIKEGPRCPVKNNEALLNYELVVLTGAVVSCKTIGHCCAAIVCCL